LETLHAVLQVGFRSLDKRSNLSKNIGLSEAEFLGQVFSHMDLSGTTLEAMYPQHALAAGSGRPPSLPARSNPLPPRRPFPRPDATPPCSESSLWETCSTCRPSRKSSRALCSSTKLASKSSTTAARSSPI